jgi:ABC-type transport system substrate-binding protein
VSELKPVKAAVVVDPMTVRLELSEPYAPLLAQLADRAGMMVSPKAARELGDRMAKRPVCAGPYKIVEWVAQDRIVLRNSTATGTRPPSRSIASPICRSRTTPCGSRICAREASS